MVSVSHEKSGASLQTGTITGIQSIFRIIEMLVFLLVPCRSFAVVITNSVTVSDCLGRVITVSTPFGVTSNSYDGTSSRILCSTFMADDVQTETFFLYNSLVARQRETYKYYDSSSPISYKTGDLFAGIGHATVHYKGYICKTATGARVDLDVTVSDDYDFHFLVSDYYKSSVDGVLGTIANNMAWSDQYFEVITRYKWTAKFKDRR